MSVIKKILPVLLLVVAVIGIFFLPVSTILMYTSPLGDSVEDLVRESTEKDETRDLSSTDIDTFTNTEFVFYVPPARFLSMKNFNYLDDAYYWNGNDDNNPSIAGSGPRNSEYYYPIANCSSVMLCAYEREAEVTVEWLNCTVLRCSFDEYNGWRAESGAKLVWADRIPLMSEDPMNVTLDTSFTYTLDEFEYVEIPVISQEIAPGWHVMSGTVRVTSDVPISVMHHKYKPGAATDTPDDHWAVACWNDMFAGYGKKMMVRVGGELFISALEAKTHVEVWDMSDRDDDASFTLERFEGWEYSRNPILQQEGFDDDIVLIAADHPVSVVGGIQAKHAFTQVYGHDGMNYHFPCFSKVLIHAPEGAHIVLEDRAGNQGSFEGDLKAGEFRMFDFKVLYKLRCCSSFEWATLRASKPVMVYTIGDNPWTLSDQYYGSIHGEDYLTTYRETSIYVPQGYRPHPADTEFTVPINSRAYVTVQNLDHENEVQVDFSELSLPLTVNLPPYSHMTMEISENSYEYIDLEGQYQRETDSFWSNKNHNYVYRIVVDNNKREDVKLSWSNLTKGTYLKVNAEKDVLVFVDYQRDYEGYVTGIDLIPGLEAPSPRSLPEGQPMLVALGGIVVAIDAMVVMCGRAPLIDQLKNWRA